MHASGFVFAAVAAVSERRPRPPLAFFGSMRGGGRGRTIIISAGMRGMALIDPLAAFGVVDLRVGRVTAAEPLPGARKPAYRLTIDFGPLGVRGSSARLTELYRPEDLVGRLVIAAVNLGARRIAGFVSEVLVLGVPDEEGRVVLLSAEREVPAGGRVY
jgi:tRNA-binding protein